MMVRPNVLRSGAPLESARAAVLLLHGRGASAEGMLQLAEEFGRSDIAYAAPQAPGATWYPYSFLAPIAQNEPHLSRSLEIVGDVMASLRADGFDAERVVLCGFSQGGCLALEYAARNAQRYGGVIGLSAGLIGPQGIVRNDAGNLHATPVFLGCSDVDAHVPLWRVQETTRILTTLGADVVERIYPGMPHTISEAEVREVRDRLARLVEMTAR